MHLEDAILAAKDFRKKRNERITRKSEQEQYVWENRKTLDSLWVEVKIFHKILSACQEINNLGKSFTVLVPLDDTKYTGLRFVPTDEITANIKKAGLNISFERNETADGCVAKVCLDCEKINYQVVTNIREDFMDFNRDGNNRKAKALFDEERPNWLLDLVGEHWEYRKSEKGRGVTEFSLAYALFNQITNEWNEAAKKDYMNFATFVPRIKFKRDEIHADFVCHAHVIGYLKGWFHKMGYDLDAKKDNSFPENDVINFCLIENNFPLDLLTGEVKKLELINSKNQ